MFGRHRPVLAHVRDRERGADHGLHLHESAGRLRYAVVLFRARGVHDEIEAEGETVVYRTVNGADRNALARPVGARAAQAFEFGAAVAALEHRGREFEAGAGHRGDIAAQGVAGQRAAGRHVFGEMRDERAGQGASIV